MAGVHSWESCLDGVALYVVYASGVEDVRNLSLKKFSLEDSYQDGPRFADVNNIASVTF